jgi:hypothetical protein
MLIWRLWLPHRRNRLPGSDDSLTSRSTHLAGQLGLRHATFHRPHPGKEALRYRVKATREFLEYMRIKP